MQPKFLWHGVAVGLLAAGLTAGEVRAQAALTGLVSSSEEGAMEGVLVSAKREGSTFTTTVVTDAQGRCSTARRPWTFPPAAELLASVSLDNSEAIEYPL